MVFALPLRGYVEMLLRLGFQAESLGVLSLGQRPRLKAGSGRIGRDTAPLPGALPRAEKSQAFSLNTQSTRSISTLPRKGRGQGHSTEWLHFATIRYESTMCNCRVGSPL